MPGDAAQVFVMVASACLIILTILAVGVSAALIRASLELVDLVRLIRGEAEALVAVRRTVAERARWILRWASVFARKARRRRR